MKKVGTVKIRKDIKIEGGKMMKRIISLFLVLWMTFLSSTNAFASSYMFQDALNETELAEIEKYGIDKDCIVGINSTENGKEYVMDFGEVIENVSIQEENDSYVKILASDGKKSNVIVIKNDGDIIIDGHEVTITNVLSEDEIVSPRAVIWKGTKSLTPYGSLTASDYDDFLTSGKQNIALGQALDDITVYALSLVIAEFHPYVGIAVSLGDVASKVYNVIASVNPKSEYVGCAYTTYTCGASDYKYVNKFYSNQECTGVYKLELSYEHFIVY